MLGEVEEYFVNLLRPGDTFMFAGRLLRFLRLHEKAVECAEGGTGDPMVPAYEGGRLPLTTNLADRVRGLLQDPSRWGLFPEQVQEWLRLQRARSRMPGRNDLLVETFPRGDRWYLVAYCFEGRNAHQTLGMLLTRRMERAGWRRWGSSPPTMCWASGRRTAARCRRAVRPGHAGRRPGGVDGGKLHAEADISQRRGYSGTDRAASSGRGQVAPAGDCELRPDL